MQKCPVDLLMKMPTGEIPPGIAASIEMHNLGLLYQCIGRQSVLIDVIDDANKNRLKSLESK